MSASGAAVVQALLSEVFATAPPADLVALVDVAAAAPRLADYKLNPVIRLPAAGRAEPRPRFALSDGGEPEAWTRRVQATWADPNLATFLGLAQPGTRRMVDTDGRRAVLYLDDLQDHGDAPVAGKLPALAGPLMCATLELPAGARGWISRHAGVPDAALLGGDPGGLVAGIARLRQAGVAALEARGAGGLWGVRWSDEGVATGALWISEARWRGTVAACGQLVTALEPPPTWARCCAALGALGWRAYADAIEVRPGGALDLTVGVLPED